MLISPPPPPNTAWNPTNASTWEGPRCITDVQKPWQSQHISTVEGASFRLELEVIFIKSSRELQMRAPSHDANANPWSPLSGNLTLNRRCEWELGKTQQKKIGIILCSPSHQSHWSRQHTRPTLHAQQFKGHFQCFIIREIHKLLINQFQSTVGFSVGAVHLFVHFWFISIKVNDGKCPAPSF